MKRYFFAMAILTLATSLLEAHGNGGSRGSSFSSGNAKSVSSSNSFDKGTKTSDSAKSQVLSNKIGDSNKTQGDKSIKATKFDLQGNKNVAKLPGFKSDPKMHAQLMQKYNVPHHLHDFCFFHQDFCWNHCCWFPSFGCCGYWHPYCHCWYYWYEPYCCYLPYSYIETYRPVAVTETPAVVVNNTNTNVNNNVEAQDPASLPPGASATLPSGVNPLIPAPKQ